MIIKGNYISDNISYSQLKTFDEEGPKGLLNRKIIDNPGVKFGTLLDDYLFLNKEEFNSKYEIVKGKVFNGDELKLANILKNRYTVDELNLITDDEKKLEEVVQLIKDNLLFKRVKNKDTFIKKFDTKEFYNFTKQLYSNKIIISIEDLVFAKTCKSSLYSNSRTSNYFLNNHENIYQADIKFKYKDENIRCLLDMLIIDHQNKTITPIDLKTGSPSVVEFKSNFFKYKYYLQSSIYMLAAQYYNNINFQGKYEVKDFKFLYLCRYDIENPLIYNVSEKWIKAGIKGFKTEIGWKYNGIDVLIDKLKWHKLNKKFDFPREIYENNEIYLDDSYILVND